MTKKEKLLFELLMALTAMDFDYVREMVKKIEKAYKCELPRAVSGETTSSYTVRLSKELKLII